MPAYTWTTGETITAAKLQALEDEAWKIANQIAYASSTSATSTTSTSFVDGAASVTFTPKTSTVYIQVQGGGLGAGVNFGEIRTATIAININSTDYTVCHHRASDYSSFGSFCGGIVVTGLTAGTSYTAKLRLRTSNASNTAFVNIDGSSMQAISVFEIQK